MALRVWGVWTGANVLGWTVYMMKSEWRSGDNLSMFLAPLAGVSMGMLCGAFPPFGVYWIAQEYYENKRD